MSIIIFIIILAALIFVHELGHFIIAKKFGIRVDEFAIGFPPKIWSKKYGETTYAINSIPFGGYVKIFGENPNEESMSGPDSARSFINASRPKQAAVLVSGIVFNILFAWIILSISFMTGLTTSVQGYGPYAKDQRIIIIAAQTDSPARRAGLVGGETLISLESGNKKIDNLSVADVQDFIAKSGGPIKINYKRDNDFKTAIITAAEGIVSGRKAIGIAMDEVGVVKLPPSKAFFEGAKLAGITTKNVAIGLYRFIFDAFRGKADFSQVTGPVGIVGLVGEASTLGIVYLMSFAAFISLNLAVINIIPFPALDGGRLLFVAIEVLRRKAISPKIANNLNAAGFALLILLMLVVTYKDIVKMF
ncbi:MAG: site-2 protease family protein [Patescibacteria group bacterium]|nr:site-2 protease family protein [Patescibacteria group bacterium]MDE2217966.1 site-2 protease family protein [Patescibacteria group bacterium]